MSSFICVAATLLNAIPVDENPYVLVYQVQVYQQLGWPVPVCCHLHCEHLAWPLFLWLVIQCRLCLTQH